jgi:hypothetical protein
VGATAGRTSGVEVLRDLLERRLAPPPIVAALDLALEEVEEGRVRSPGAATSEQGFYLWRRLWRRSGHRHCGPYLALAGRSAPRMSTRKAFRALSMPSTPVSW